MHTFFKFLDYKRELPVVTAKQPLRAMFLIVWQQMTLLVPSPMDQPGLFTFFILSCLFTCLVSCLFTFSSARRSYANPEFNGSIRSGSKTSALTKIKDLTNNLRKNSREGLFTYFVNYLFTFFVNYLFTFSSTICLHFLSTVCLHLFVYFFRRNGK